MSTDNETTSSLAVLYLDDEAPWGQILEDTLDLLSDIDVRFEHVERLEQALVKLQGGEFDILFLDHHLKSARTGLDVLKYLRDADYEGPIVMLTNEEGDGLVANYLRYGADAYLSKDDLNPEQLRAVVQVALAVPHRDRPRIFRDGE